MFGRFAEADDALGGGLGREGGDVERDPFDDGVGNEGGDEAYGDGDEEALEEVELEVDVAEAFEDEVEGERTEEDEGEEGEDLAGRFDGT